MARMISGGCGGQWGALPATQDMVKIATPLLKFTTLSLGEMTLGNRAQ